jgi:hypothetical protein
MFHLHMFGFDQLCRWTGGFFDCEFDMRIHDMVGSSWDTFFGLRYECPSLAGMAFLPYMY